MRNRLLILVHIFTTWLGMSVLPCCQMVRDPSNHHGKSDTETPSYQPSKDTQAKDIPCDKNQSQGIRPIVGPVILIHAWGAKMWVNMSKFRGYLEQAGVAEEDIFEPSYPYMLSLDQIKERMVEQFDDIAERYPDETKFTVITHSLGQFVGLYALLESNWYQRVDKFVSFGGFIHGQEKKPALCLGNVCGPIWSHLVPYNNDFIRKFLKKHDTPLSKLSKCSLSSPADDKVDAPARAGDFEDGTNVLLKEELSHRDLVRDSKAFDAMLKHCFDKIAPQRCIEAPTPPKPKP